MFDNLRNRLDFDDLLFKSRNRDYGAYQLRKKYNSILFTGIVIATLLMSSAVILPFILANNSDRIINGRGTYVQVKMEVFDAPVDEYVPPPPPPPSGAIKTEEIVRYVPPVVVDSVLAIENKMASTDQVLNQSVSDQVESAGIGTGDDLLSGQDGTETDEPFYLVEVMPSFKGGDLNKFRDWVQRRTNYPQIAIDNKIQGRVFLTFIVETDGSVSNVTVVKGVDPIIDNEAVKSIQSSPKWSPGLQRGQSVRVRYSMSLNFTY